MSTEQQERRVFAVADVVPDYHRIAKHITAGKEYEVRGDTGTGFEFKDDAGSWHYAYWQGSTFLNGGDWRRVEREPEAPKAADKWYSADNETFNSDEMVDAVQLRASQMDGPITGEVITIYEGERGAGYSASQWTPDMVEYLGERAADDAGEVAYDWPPANKQQCAELQAAVEKVVEDWAARHKLEPTFFEIVNVREIKVRLTSEDGDFEVVDETAQAEGGAV